MAGRRYRIIMVTVYLEGMLRRCALGLMAVSAFAQQFEVAAAGVAEKADALGRRALQRLVEQQFNLLLPVHLRRPLR